MTNAGIEAFLIVCKQHSISKAAAELFISQSSLSIRLRTLEKEVGCPLFFRHKGSREMVLTEEGKRFLPAVPAISGHRAQYAGHWEPEKQSAAVRSQQRVHVSAAAGV